MTFKGHTFYPIASLTNTVPVLTTGGLAKRWLVPGWRVGWVFIHDRNAKFQEVRKGLVNLSQLTLGANSLVQSAIPEFLQAPQSFFESTLDQLQENAELSRSILANVPGITPIFPQGAMYLMLKIDIERFKGIKDDVDFVEKLVQEEAVLCLPGQCFRCPGCFVRIVFTAPKDKLESAFKRIKEFCARYYQS